MALRVAVTQVRRCWMYGFCYCVAEGIEEGVSFAFDPVRTDPYELLVEIYVLDPPMMTMFMMMHRQNH